MADRFKNANPANDKGGIASDDPDVHGYDPTKKGFFHGGDLQGLLEKIDYIEGLGTTAIWLTPSFKNRAVQGPPGQRSAGYHGYWVTDFTQIDPHFGTNARAASSSIDAAHARGIKVFFDIITNHTADVIAYTENRYTYVSKDTEPFRTASGTPFDDRDYAGTNTFPALDAQASFPLTPYVPPGIESKTPAWLNDLTLYHNRGDTTFVGEDSLYGDFFGLDDLFTEHPRVVDGMIDIYETWIRDMRIDGFRIDTMKHVNDEFWQKFSPAVLQYAKDVGKPDFFMFGEVADGTRPLTSHYTTHNHVQSVLDFPFQEAARAWVSKSGAEQRAAATSSSTTTTTPTPTRTPTSCRRSSATTTPATSGCSCATTTRPAPPRTSCCARQARARPDVPLPRQPGRLLRRRAGLHGRGQRPGRAPGPVQEQSTSSTTTRATTREERQHRLALHAGELLQRRGQLLDRPPAVPRDRGAGAPGQGAPGAARRRPAAPLRGHRPGRLRLQPHPRRRPARVRRRAQQRRDGQDGGDPDLDDVGELRPDLRREHGHACAPTANGI